MKTLLIFITFISIILEVEAQFPSEGQYQTIFSAIPAMPDYLSTIEDTSVPDAITIKRITTYNAQHDWYPTHDYAKIQPWNADASLYRISAVALYDATTHQEYRDLPGGQIYPVYWSNTDRNLMYSFRENGDIRTYTVSTENVQTVHSLVGYDIVKLGPGEGNIDITDHYVALIGKRGVDMDVIIFDLQMNEVVHTEVFSGAWGNATDVPDYVDWVSVSQSGDYVGIMWNHNTTSQGDPFNNHYGVEIYNTVDMQYKRRIAKYGNHGDFGYAQDGDEVFVQFWGETGTLNMYYLNRLERVVLSTHADFNSEGHVSCRNLNRPGYAYVSQDNQDHSGQIIAFKLDSSGLVEHFGHHYSSASSYVKSPMPVPTPNGEKVIFKSDFGNDANADEAYVFEAYKSTISNIDENPNNLAIKISPNPAVNNIDIISNQILTEIKLYSSLGILVKSIAGVNSKTKRINIATLPIGIYFLTITGKKNKQTTYKIIKN